MLVNVKVVLLASALLCGAAFSAGALFEKNAAQTQAQHDSAERKGLTSLFSGDMPEGSVKP